MSWRTTQLRLYTEDTRSSCVSRLKRQCPPPLLLQIDLTSTTNWTIFHTVLPQHLFFFTPLPHVSSLGTLHTLRLLLIKHGTNTFVVLLGDLRAKAGP